MQVGDIVKSSERQVSDEEVGIVVETKVNMWNKEVMPSCVRVLWSCGTLEIVYEDEIEGVSESW